MHLKCAGCNPETTQVTCLTCEELDLGQIDRAPAYGEQHSATGAHEDPLHTVLLLGTSAGFTQNVLDTLQHAGLRAHLICNAFARHEPGDAMDVCRYPGWPSKDGARGLYIRLLSCQS